jgi:hypothetical protein
MSLLDQTCLKRKVKLCTLLYPKVKSWVGNADSGGWRVYQWESLRGLTQLRIKINIHSNT